MTGPMFRIKKLKKSDGDIVYVLYEKRLDISKSHWFRKRYYWYLVGTYINNSRAEAEILKRAPNPHVLSIEDYDDSGRPYFYGF